MSTSDRRSYHHGDLRAALLRSALDLLDADGADALSLRAVARHAGVSANAPYRHYQDKEALLAALAAHGFTELKARFEEASDGSKGGTASAPADLVALWRPWRGPPCVTPSTTPASSTSCSGIRASAMPR